MFHITAIDGDNYLRLDKNQIAITDKAAQRIFGTESPIGKQLVFPQKNNDEKTIVAVVKSWEGHSLYSFDILLPYYDWEPDWGRQQCNTLFRVYPNSDIKHWNSDSQKLKWNRTRIKGRYPSPSLL